MRDSLYEIYKHTPGAWDPHSLYSILIGGDDRFIGIADAYGSKLAFVNRELYFFVKNLAQGRAARGISSESIWKSACMMTFKDFLFVIKKIRFYFIDFQI